jgi:hypothetical protein
VESAAGNELELGLWNDGWCWAQQGSARLGECVRCVRSRDRWDSIARADGDALVDEGRTLSTLAEG